MTDSRRFLLLLLSGLLLFGGVIAAVLEATPPAVAVVQSPVLEVPASATSVPPTTTGALTVETTPRAVAPPADPYVAEPIREIGTIEIPKIGLTHKLMHGISMRNIDQGPSHWPGTPLPGETGNVVVMGHRVTKTRPFYRINELQPGDEVFFEVAGVRTRYVMTSFEIVAANRLDIINPTPTPTATLFACHPRGSARQRYVVRLALAEE